MMTSRPAVCHKAGQTVKTSGGGTWHKVG